MADAHPRGEDGLGPGPGGAGGGLRARSPSWAEAAAEVDAAYQLRDGYRAAQKLELQRHAARAHELLALLLPESPVERALLLRLRGTLLASTHEYSAEAEALLTRAVKLDPRSVDAWNTLAECVWKGGQLELARACLREALRVRANAGSLCQLSMLLRAMSNAALVPESLRLAREAVTLDVGCGRSWMVLGSAFLASYFASSHRLDDLHSALKAYRRAASAPRRPQGECADLHYNTGIVLQYTLEYGQAAASFARAHELGPELNAASHRRALLEFARKCADALRARGHLPRKRLQQLEQALRAAPDLPPAAASLDATPVAALGLGPNPRACLSASVVAELVPAAQTPLCYALVDRAGDAILLCVYNASQSAVQVGQTVSVLAPTRRTVRLHLDDSGGELSFDALVVEEPASQLLVQGRPVARTHVGRARVTSVASP